MATIVEFLLAGMTDHSGEPLANGRVYSYEAGSTTPKFLYVDNLAETEEENPVELDAYGRKQVYGDGAYKLVIKTANDELLYTFDNLFLGGNPDFTFLGTTTGSSGSYVATPSPALSELVDGAIYIFQANHINTGAATLNISGLGAKALSGIVGQIVTGFTYLVRYKASTDSFSIVNLDPGYATTQAEMLALSTAGAEVRVRQSITLTSNLTVATPLTIEKGGKIVTDGNILTINGPLRAGDYQIFDTDTAEVVFGQGAVTESRFEWFGATGDGSTDDTEAMQTALDVSATAYVPVRVQAKRTYMMSAITLKAYSKIIGHGETRSQSVIKANSSSVMFTIDTGPYVETFISFEGITLHGNSTAARIVDVIGGAQNTHFKKCQFREFVTAVKIDAGIWTYFDRCEFNGTDLASTVYGVYITGVANAIYLDRCNFGGFLDYCVYADTSWGGNTLDIDRCCFDNIGNQNTVYLDHSAPAPALNVMMSSCRFDGASNAAQVYLGANIWAGVIRDSSFVDTCVNNIKVAGWYAWIHNNHVADATGAAIDLTASSKWCDIGMQSWGSSPGADIADAGTENRIHRKVLKGTTANRPTPLGTEYGRLYLDTTLAGDGKPIFWNGAFWVDGTGTLV